MKKRKLKKILSIVSMVALLAPSMVNASPVEKYSGISDTTYATRVVNASSIGTYSSISDTTYTARLENWNWQLYVMVSYKIVTADNGKQYKMITQAFTSNEYNPGITIIDPVIVGNDAVDVYFIDGLGRNLRIRLYLD